MRELKTTFRPSPLTILSQIWLVLIPTLVVGGFALSNVLDRPTIRDTVVVLSCVFTILVCVVRAAMCLLELDESGVRVHNFWSRRFIPWNSVTLIGWDYYSSSPRGEFLSPCVAFTVSDHGVSERVLAKVCTGQSRSFKESIVASLRDFSKRKGIPIDLSLEDLEASAFDARIPPHPPKDTS